MPWSLWWHRMYFYYFVQKNFCFIKCIQPLFCIVCLLFFWNSIAHESKALPQKIQLQTNHDNITKMLQNIITMTNQNACIEFHKIFIFILKMFTGERQTWMEMLGKNVSVFVNAWKQIVSVDKWKYGANFRMLLEKKKERESFLRWRDVSLDEIQIILTENFVITHYTALNLIWVICKAKKVSNYLLFRMETTDERFFFWSSNETMTVYERTVRRKSMIKI